MKKVLLMLSFFVLILSCKKDEDVTTSTGPNIVRDQAKVEQNLPGIWKGSLRATGGAAEPTELEIDQLILGSKVGKGRHGDASYSIVCEFDLTGISFSKGIVTLQDKTSTASCYDSAGMILSFRDNDFSKIYVVIKLPNSSNTVEGFLNRQ